MKRNKVKTLKNKAEKLWKEVCYKKYGRYCHVETHAPHIKIKHTKVIQIDHCITRANKYFFLDTNNGLPVCSSCNRAKCFKQRGVDEAITEMVRLRNPQWYKDALWLHQSGEPNPSFSKIWWLKEKIIDLEEELKELNEGQD